MIPKGGPDSLVRDEVSVVLGSRWFMNAVSFWPCTLLLLLLLLLLLYCVWYLFVCFCVCVCVCLCWFIPSVMDIRPRTKGSRGEHGRVLNDNRAFKETLFSIELFLLLSVSERDIGFTFIFRFTFCNTVWASRSWSGRLAMSFRLPEIGKRRKKGKTGIKKKEIRSKNQKILNGNIWRIHKTEIMRNGKKKLITNKSHKRNIKAHFQ